jgi:hypothetical protein
MGGIRGEISNPESSNLTPKNFFCGVEKVRKEEERSGM